MMLKLKMFLSAFTSSDSDSLESRFFSWIFWGVILCCVLMLPQRMYYVLSGDELALALNFHERTVLNMLATPLENNQMAPLGFVFATKLITSVFGMSEITFRIVPFVGYMALLAGIVYFLRTIFKTSLTFALGCTAFVATNSIIFRYGWTFKPYITDCACMFLISIAYYHFMQSRLSFRWLAILMSVSIWFSLPAAFFTGGVVICELLTAVFTREKIRFRNAMILGACISACFALHYCVWLYNPKTLGAMNNIWCHANFTVCEGIGKIKEQVDGLFTHFGNFGNILFLASVMEAIYCTIKFKEAERKAVLALIFGVLLALFASHIGKYPYIERLFLFVLPLCIVLSFLFCLDILKITEKTKYASAVCLGLVSLSPFILLENWSWYKIESPCNFPPIRSEWRNPLREIGVILEENVKVDDTLAVVLFYKNQIELFPAYFPESLREHPLTMIAPPVAPENNKIAWFASQRLVFPREILKSDAGYVVGFDNEFLRNFHKRPYCGVDDTYTPLILSQFDGKYLEKLYDYGQFMVHHYVSNPADLKTKVEYRYNGQTCNTENVSLIRILVTNIGSAIIDMKTEKLYLEGVSDGKTLVSMPFNSWNVTQIYPGESMPIFFRVDWGDADSVDVQLVNKGKYAFSELGIPPLTIQRERATARETEKDSSQNEP